MPRSTPTILLALLAAAGCATAPPAEPPADPPSARAAWLRSLGGLGPDIPFAVGATSDGEVVAAGTFANRAEFGAEALDAPRNRDIFVARLAADGAVRWARRLGGRPGDEPRALAIDGDGNAWVVGFFTAALGDERSGSALVSNGGADAFVVALTPDGEVAARFAFGGPLADNANAIAVDDRGRIIVAGTFQDELALGSHTLRSAGGRDAFVAAFDPDGTPRWAMRYGGPRTDEARKILLAGDEIWVAGTFEGEIGARRSRGWSDVFVLRLGSDGTTLAETSLGGSGTDRVAGLAAAPGGTVRLVGDFQRTLHDGSGRPLVDSVGGADIFVADVGADGAVVRAARFGGEVTDQALTASTSASGGVLIGGYFQGRSDLDPGPAELWVESPDPTNADGFVVELSSDGTLAGARRLGDDGVEQVLAVVAADDGGFAAAGLFKERLALPWLSPAAVVEGLGKSDVFVVRSRF